MIDCRDFSFPEKRAKPLHGTVSRRNPGLTDGSTRMSTAVSISPGPPAKTVNRGNEDVSEGIEEDEPGHTSPSNTSEDGSEVQWRTLLDVKDAEISRLEDAIVQLHKQFGQAIVETASVAYAKGRSKAVAEFNSVESFYPAPGRLYRRGAVVEDLPLTTSHQLNKWVVSMVHHSPEGIPGTISDKRPDNESPTEGDIVRNWEQKPAIPYNGDHVGSRTSWIYKNDTGTEQVHRLSDQKIISLPRIRQKPWVKEWEKESQAVATTTTSTASLGELPSSSSNAGPLAERLIKKQTRNSRRRRHRQVQTPDTNIMALRGGILEVYEVASQSGHIANNESLRTSSDIYQGRSSEPDCSNSFLPRRDDNAASVYGKSKELEGDGSLSLDDPRSPHGSYSHSVTWVSKEQLTLVRFQKCMTNLRSMGCDKSPFISGDFMQWMDLMIHYRIAKFARGRLQIRLRHDELDVMRRALSHREDVDKVAEDFTALLSPKLIANSVRHKKSTVLMRDTPWICAYTDQPLSDWPPEKEFKKNGDNRAKFHPQQKRRLPSPRARKLHKCHYHRLQKDLKGIPPKGPGVPYELRESNDKLANMNKDMRPQTGARGYCPHGYSDRPVLYHELDHFTQTLIMEIDRSTLNAYE
ncbi:hypothetical protein SUNI508_09444 [Seiridium unicorne]|uniref:Uncharacterized protein n=1 Tax=Seiridium unicorne TaxID=138068 RepID=A0ABR2UQD1_9PEZI